MAVTKLTGSLGELASDTYQFISFVGIISALGAAVLILIPATIRARATAYVTTVVPVMTPLTVALVDIFIYNLEPCGWCVI